MNRGDSLEALRQASQLAFIASGRELAVGDVRDCPLPPELLARTRGAEPHVVATFDSGLTARVFRMHLSGREWAVKVARSPCLVQNVDGQTSFLNELQRRSEFAALTAQPDGRERFAGIAQTTYASLRQGLIVSPWIDGENVAAWDERRLEQFFALGTQLVLEGFFEWDFCSGNILDDGRQIFLFDFGYMYRFDPLRHFNSAGNGDSAPQFHLAERLETRNYLAALLEIEQAQGIAAALAAFRLEKTIALDAYRRLHSLLAQRGATRGVLGWLDGIVARWDAGLAGDLEALYLVEGWRSHSLDLDDDLHGRTCTPMTLRRADWLLATLRSDSKPLRELGALTEADARLNDGELSARYASKRAQATLRQVAP